MRETSLELNPDRNIRMIIIDAVHDVYMISIPHGHEQWEQVFTEEVLPVTQYRSSRYSGRENGLRAALSATCN